MYFLVNIRPMVAEVVVEVPCGRPVSNLLEEEKSKLKGETGTLMGAVELEEGSQSITTRVVFIATMQTPVVDKRDPEESVIYSLNQEVLASFIWMANLLKSKIYELTTKGLNHYW